MDLTTGSLRYAGGYGDYWYNTAYPGSTTATYILDFNTDYVSPSNHHSRYVGFAGRCTAISSHSKTWIYDCNFSRKISLTTDGLAFPAEAFMTCPTKKPRTFSCPAR